MGGAKDIPCISHDPTAQEYVAVVQKKPGPKARKTFSSSPPIFYSVCTVLCLQRASFQVKCAGA